MTEKMKKIKPAEDYGSMKDADVQTLGETVAANLTNNSSLPAPTVDPKVLKADADNFGAAIVAAQDGGKKAVAQKNKARKVVVKDLRLIGRYVEEIADGDMAIFSSSGLTPTSGVRTLQVVLSSNFRSVDHGKLSGQIVIRLKAISGALSYELRFAPETNGAPGTWTSQIVTGVKTPVTLSSLTPGTVYAFQARAMDKAGYSDWSNSVTMMCT
ncbi:MAG TPA: fibronectin type III domain-containing protein [Terriglobia bacterium]|jgi:hypothetical protein